MFVQVRSFVRIGSVLMLLSAFACTSSQDDPEPTGSHSGVDAAGQGAAAHGGDAAGQGAVAGGGMGVAGKSAAGAGAGAGNTPSAGRGGSGASAAGSGGSAGSAGQDAGQDDVDAAVSCDGEIVADRSRCLQDDAFCIALGDGRYCTGPRAPQNPPSMKPCGARAGDTCGADEYCAYRPGEYCGQADAQATCQKRPSSCSSPSSPVCGCDQRTYQSACEANKAGSGIFTAEACK